MALMSGARPPLLPGRVAELTPELAMSGATGCPAERATRYTIPPRRRMQRTAAMVQARRSEAGVVAAPPTGCPHRWQNRAWGESSARHTVHARAVRLAPQWLQKLPEVCLPQAGQVAVIGRSVNGER
jgi:hypothetical protein